MKKEVFYINNSHENISPGLIFWELTQRCNLRCVHCRASVSPFPLPGELTEEEIKKVIDDLTVFGRPILVLTGGEPLYRSDIFDIIDYGVKMNFPVALATNGTLIDEIMADKIVSSGVRRVSISIDGASSITHDGFRGIAGSFQDTMKGFYNLKKLGMSIQFNTTITRHNFREIPDILNMAVNLGADALHIFLLVPVGCGVELSKEQQITPDEYENILNWFYEESESSPIQLKATCAPHYFRIMAQRGKDIVKRGHGMSAMTRGCLAGRGILFISSMGDVRPCGYLPVSAGNIRNKKIEEIWDNGEIFRELRNLDNLRGKCRVCEFKHICMGCRARAYGESGDYMGEEPFCSYIPRKIKELKR